MLIAIYFLEYIDSPRDIENVQGHRAKYSYKYYAERGDLHGEERIGGEDPLRLTGLARRIEAA